MPVQQRSTSRLTFISAFESSPVHCLKRRPWGKRCKLGNGGAAAILSPHSECVLYMHERLTGDQYRQEFHLLEPHHKFHWGTHTSIWPGDLWNSLWWPDGEDLVKAFHEYLHGGNRLWRANMFVNLQEYYLTWNHIPQCRHQYHTDPIVWWKEGSQLECWCIHVCGVWQGYHRDLQVVQCIWGYDINLARGKHHKNWTDFAHQFWTIHASMTCSG